MKLYDHKSNDAKWQKKWEEEKLYKTDVKSGKKKSYLLVEFPYPSGAGLHVGHVRSYTAMDILARKRRSEGYEVLFPMGWDAFGLPAENYAIKTGIHPSITTRENITNFRKQLKACGFSFDWNREVDTTDPLFYKWSQWIFLKLYENGLAYKKKMPVNWCPKDKCVLANEEVVDGKCERCGTGAEKKDKEQWMLAITKYAERLDKDLDETTYLEKIKIQQRNWIGISEGSEIDFALVGDDYSSKFTVFTTRADTLFGCTYCVLAPEHPLVEEMLAEGLLTNGEEVTTYRTAAKQKLDIDRSAEGKEKTGVKLEGVFAINPANQKEVPIFIADYVLPNYGSGAIMAVPAHDERDYQFAKKYGVPVVEVISKHYVLTGDDGERPECETVVRAIVDPVIKDKDGNFYFIKEKGTGHVHFAGGGVDDGETEEEALLREIKEETGFVDIASVKRINLLSSVYGYRHTKSRNQRTLGPAFEVILETTKRVPSEVEDGDHELVSFTKDDALAAISWPHHRDILNFYLSGKEFFTEDGVLVNSGKYTGLSSEEARKKITEDVSGTIVTKSKLRDWVFARQRYWGEPIPIVYDKDGRMYPVSDTEFPIVLPEVEKYEPTDTGESPLAQVTEWVHVRGVINENGHFVSKSDGEIFRRETDTMPQWAGSSWYFMRYIDPTNTTEIGNKELLAKWLPVDWYNGGMEHTTLHLLYSRFWYKFLFDIGLVPTSEPYYKRTSQGMILGAGGIKMSKSLGNVVNPDDIINAYGADVLRVYEMFVGPFDQAVAWDEKGIVGVSRFLDKVYTVSQKVFEKEGEVGTLTHRTIKSITEGIESTSFNTCISTLMIWINEYEKTGTSVENFKLFLKLLSPFAPHLSEELWHTVGENKSVHTKKWPIFDSSKLLSDVVTIAFQVSGKLRGTVEIARDLDEKTVLEIIQNHEMFQKYVGNQGFKKAIVVKNKIVNIVI
jgi:leucyl-tRNA synthetase